VDRAHRRAAEAVDRHPAHRKRQIGEQPDHACNVQPLLALRKGAAEHHVLDQAEVDARAVEQPTDHLRGKVVRTDACQVALAGEVERRAGIARDHGLGHRLFETPEWQARLAVSP
jgi:hypothetical protein